MFLPKNGQNQHFYGFSDRDKNFLENNIDRNKTLKTWSFGCETAKNITITAEKRVVTNIKLHFSIHI